ncbi:hypothetical protein TrCOL_g10951 [Triparma columacea]|uniref:Uncharacterized protein n=1 Tax=Triparma columacea TaxID=722753 RepID=A0A9W7LDN4_9STRA|nr:hypothetical protein TrCOL_g10951 [Triparma columacea]
MPILIPVLLTNPTPAKAAYDVSVTNKAISIKPKSSEEARKRFQEARTSINYLLQNYDTICEGGGDNIRRYLGTVGTSSPLYGIKSVFKYLQEESEDIVEFTENMNEFDRNLTGADGQAYSSMFVEFSAAKGTTKDYYKEAFKEVQMMKKAIDNMNAELI